MTLKKIMKLIHLLLLTVLLGQYAPLVVEATQLYREGMTDKQLPAFYSFKAEARKELEAQLPSLLAKFEMERYVVQQPVLLLSYEEEREDAYYPVLADGKLQTFIRFNQQENTYRIENEEIVNQIRNLTSTEKTPCLFIEVNNEILGKTNEMLMNFS